MATILYPTAAAQTGTLTSHYGSATKKVLSLARGAGVQSDVRNTAAALNISFASPNIVQMWGADASQTLATSGQNNTWVSGTLVFVSNPLNAVTIATAPTVNYRGLENNAMANYGGGGIVLTVNSAGTTNLAISRFDPPAELGVTEAASTCAGTLVLSRTLAAGDRLVVIFGYCSVGTSASGFTATGLYAGASGATGDCFVTFAETITEQAGGSTYTKAGYGRESL